MIFMDIDINTNCCLSLKCSPLFGEIFYLRKWVKAQYGTENFIFCFISFNIVKKEQQNYGKPKFSEFMMYLSVYQVEI